MAIAETIINGFFKVLGEPGGVDITHDSRNLGMAYAIPVGSEATVVNDFSPWTPCDVKQVFFRQSVVGRPMVEVQLVLSWRVNASRQFIVEAFLDKNVAVLEPGVSLSVSVRFNQPEQFDFSLEAFQIPFLVEVNYKPLLGHEVRISRGVIRADGTGEFPAFD